MGTSIETIVGFGLLLALIMFIATIAGLTVDLIKIGFDAGRSIFG